MHYIQPSFKFKDYVPIGQENGSWVDVLSVQIWQPESHSQNPCKGGERKKIVIFDLYTYMCMHIHTPLHKMYLNYLAHIGLLNIKLRAFQLYFQTLEYKVMKVMPKYYESTAILQGIIQILQIRILLGIFYAMQSTDSCFYFGGGFSSSHHVSLSPLETEFSIRSSINHFPCSVTVTFLSAKQILFLCLQKTCLCLILEKKMSSSFKESHQL